MRYFALYQREFSGIYRLLERDSHVFVDYISADGLEEVFAQSQSEVMTETRRCRVQLSPVHHTLMSMGDLLIDEAGHLFAGTPVGFKKVRLDTLESRTELALHLFALGLEKTPGWTGLFEHAPALLGAAIVDRLRSGIYGTTSYALGPHPIPPAQNVAP